MNDFTDPDRSLPELVIQGSVECDIENYSNDEMLEMFASWRNRIDKTDANPEQFNRDGTLVFTISYQGKSDHYWPDKNANQITEALLRDVLFNDGICNLESFAPKLFQVNFKVIAMEETEYLLVLPYPTASGNINGLVVVCVNKYLRS